MPEDKFTFLGRRIRAARKECKLTQQELADQSKIKKKTIQDIEKGRKNPTYETLCMLIDRLGVSPNTLFPSKSNVDKDSLQHFLGKLQSCNKQNQKMVLNSLNFLVDQVLEIQNNPENDESL